MNVVIDQYENRKINNGVDMYTEHSSLCEIGNESGLAAVSHKRMKSIKSIVNAYVRRLERDADYGYPGAKYNVVINLTKTPNSGVPGFRDPDEVVTIGIRCE